MVGLFLHVRLASGNEVDRLESKQGEWIVVRVKGGNCYCNCLSYQGCHKKITMLISSLSGSTTMTHPLLFQTISLWQDGTDGLINPKTMRKMYDSWLVFVCVQIIFI